MIKGNTDGIKDHILADLDSLYDIKTEKGKLIDDDILQMISIVSAKLNREINISIDRRGNITEISIGDCSSAQLPAVDAGEKRLSGVRMIHTHPSGNSRLSSVDISALIKLRLDAILAVGIRNDGSITGITMGYCHFDGSHLSYEMIGPVTVSKIFTYDYLSKVEDIESSLRKNVINKSDDEYAILVGIDTEDALKELEELAEACDIKTIGKFLQKRTRIDNVTFIGSGKAHELGMLRQIKAANIVIFDDELTGAQIKNLESIVGCKVIDRTILILEIFARRAKSAEGKIQVQLAQLKHQGTKLLGYGATMSRIGGGMGTRGSGETKLELDRRRIRDDIHELNEKLEKLRNVRTIQRNKRERAGIPKISLVGYTNVGKSTLRNLLSDMYPYDNSSSKDDVLAKDMLFATLDVTTRTILLPDKRAVSLTDTVGFIRKLPHELIEAFKSTLEEVKYSDLIIHVADASSPDIDAEIEAVERVLDELGSLNNPTILAFNKIDKIDQLHSADIKRKYENYNVVEISASTGKNIDILLKAIEKALPSDTKEISYLIPYSDTAAASALHRDAIVISEEFGDPGILMKVSISEKLSDKYSKYMKTIYKQ